MTANNPINTVLCSLSNLENKYDFIEDGDVSFLNEFFKRYQSLILMKETLENNDSIYDDVIEDKTLETLTDIIRKNSKKNREAGKLYHILKKVHFKALFSCLKELNNEEHIPISYRGSLQEIDITFKKTIDYHDGHSESEETDQPSLYSENSEISEEDVSNHNFNLPTYENIKYNDNKRFSYTPDVQIISVKREPNQPLGITVVKTNLIYDEKSINRCTIERILVNSLIDKQGLLQVGDVILEVNEKPIENPEELQFLLGKCKGTIAFKILKSSKRPISNAVEKVYMRALFDYDPSKDKLLPAEQIGLAFKAGDVFEVLNRDDPSFWQAVALDSVDNQAFLIPSQSLQERLIALRNDLKPRSNENISGKAKRKKSKKNEIFRAKDAADMVSEADLHTYEEVVKFPPSRVPCVLLIGPSGVGKKAIKHLLVQKEPHRFSFPIQDTSEAKKNRNQPLFNHVDRNAMLNDIKASLYVCLEEKSGELYGIKSSAIRELVNQGKTVVLDCQPKEVYHLKTPIFNPYVILIGAPTLTVLEAMQKEGLQKNFTKNKRSTAELQEIINQSNDFEIMYKHLINIIIVNDDIHQTTKYVSSILSDFENNHSWIPASWEFDMAPLPINKLPINNKTMKSIDNSTLNSTGGRRYEKRNEKPSVSLSSNRAPLNQNEYSSSLDDDDDEEEEDNEEVSDTNSEENVVMAKPVKFLNAAKKPEVTIDRTDAKPIKYSNSKKLDDKSPLKHSNSKTTDNVPIKHSNSKSDDKIYKKPEDKSIKHSNSKSDEKLSKQHSSVKKEEKPLKSSNSKKTEDVPLRKDEKPTVKHSTSRKSEEVSPKVKEKSIEITTPSIHMSNKPSQPLETPKTANSNNKNPKTPVIATKPKVVNQNVITPRSKNKPPEVNLEENMENNRRVSQQKPVSTKTQPQSIDRRMKIVRKENSSSEISDTSSDSDDGGLVENRV